MYADDTAIFVKPYKRDVTTLAKILVKFGDATGLKTNVEKSSVIPIRCQGVNLDEVSKTSSLPNKIPGATSNKHQIAKDRFSVSC